MARFVMCFAGLLIAVLYGAAIPDANRARAQSRDAESVLRDMRAALGGEAALDAIQRFTVNGTIRRAGIRSARFLSIEMFVLLPDHFLEIERDSDSTGPVPLEITYYRGFRGDELIRRTNSTIPFPPDPWPQIPAVIAERERAITLKNKQHFARVALILFGRSFSSYSLQFAYLGTEQRDGRAVDVLEATGSDGYRMRLSVDAATHLPTTIAYLAAQGVVVSTSSRVLLRGNEVVSETPMGSLPRVDVGGLPLVEHRLTASNFKAQDGVNWPRRLTITVGADVLSRTDLGKYRLNPKLEPRRFDIKR